MGDNPFPMPSAWAVGRQAEERRIAPAAQPSVEAVE